MAKFMSTATIKDIALWIKNKHERIVKQTE
jgi:hypothetical protein